MKNAISLFAGAGGCSLGLKQAGFSVRLASDIDQNACVTYARNLGPEGIWRTDLAEAAPTDSVEKAGLPSTALDLIVGGPPCQGFSSAGARDWDDSRNTLLRKFVEFVTSLKPTWFVMENVEGLLTAAQGSFFIEAIARFLEAGYWVRAEKVYMERFGLPQKRKRVLVVGNLEQCDFRFPEPTHSEPMAIPLFNDSTQLTVCDAIGDLPTPLTGLVYYDRPEGNDYQQFLRRSDGRPIGQHHPKQLSELNQARVSLLNQGQSMRDLPEHLQHPSFSRRAFRRVMDGTPTEKRGGAPSGMKRLEASKPSLTITSASASEFIHPVEDRLITLRECARIQSFPDWFEFHGSWSSIATQIGNAIPPMYMRILADQISSQANWVPIPESGGRWLGIEASKAIGKSPALNAMLEQLKERTLGFTG